MATTQKRRKASSVSVPYSFHWIRIRPKIWSRIRRRNSIKRIRNTGKNKTFYQYLFGNPDHIYTHCGPNMTADTHWKFTNRPFLGVPQLLRLEVVDDVWVRRAAHDDDLVHLAGVALLEVDEVAFDRVFGDESATVHRPADPQRVRTEREDFRYFRDDGRSLRRGVLL